MQWACDVVEDWCKLWLMSVSVGKCSVTLFSNDPRDRYVHASVVGVVEWE